MTETEELLLRRACGALAQEEADALDKDMSLSMRREARDVYLHHRKTVSALIRRTVPLPKPRLRFTLRAAACAAAAAALLFAFRLWAPEKRGLDGAVMPVPTSATLSLPGSPSVPTNDLDVFPYTLEKWELFPTYLPDGCVLSAETEGDRELTAVFALGDTAFRFTQADGAYLYPVTGEEPVYLSLNGAAAVRTMDNGRLTLVWDQEGRTLSLTGDAAQEDELMKIARSVRRTSSP